MDNLTHTMAGLWVGEFAYRISRKGASKDSEIDFQPAKRSRRPWFWLIGAIANNFPDLDFVFNPMLPAPINYLLHHRGFTHTLLGIVIQAPLIVLLLLLIPKFKNLVRDDAVALRTSFLLAFVGLCMHIGFDFLNSYGVHPFFPFNTKWYYGDMVFIVEPMMWVIFGIPFALSLHRWPRRLWAIFLLGTPLVFTFYNLLPWFSLLTIWLVGMVLTATFRKGYSSTRVFRYSLGTFAFFLGVHGSFSAWANSKLTQISKIQFPNETIIDNALTPLPTDPICFTFVSLSVSPDNKTYFIRRGQMALLSRFFEAEMCRLPVREQEKSMAFHSGILWFSELQQSVENLSARAEKECFLHSWLRYARMPDVDDTRAVDSRFSGFGRENFTTLRFANFAGLECPKWIPPWTPPRQDLLDLGRPTASQ